MGYTTEFDGRFVVEKLKKNTGSGATAWEMAQLPTKVVMLLKELRDTDWRATGRTYPPVVLSDKKMYAKKAPSYWCQWEVKPGGDSIGWDGNEKFYEYEAWLRVVQAVLKEHGYRISGTIRWRGEEFNDVGRLSAGYQYGDAHAVWAKAGW